MGSIGERLRQARESQKREVSQIAEELRISARYLKAIEADDFSSLPGGLFTKSFVRQYAATLGLASSEVERALAKVFGQLGDPILPSQPSLQKTYGIPPLSVPGRSRKGKPVRSLAALLAVVLVCAAFYAYWLGNQEESEVALVTEAPEVVPPAETPPPPVAAAPEAPAVESESPVAAPAEEPPPPATTPLSPGEGPLQFHIRASEDTWVRVLAGGRTLFSGILGAGESKSFSGLEKAVLRIGNAGGLSITANGRTLSPVGGRGQVRVVTLTPEGSEVSVPIRRPPPVMTPEESDDPGTTGS